MNIRSLFYFTLAGIAGLAASCSDSDGTTETKVVNPTPKEQWGETWKGNAGTVFAYPDMFVNYWEYTWLTSDSTNIALRIKGAYPHARFFSLSLYDDERGDAIGGLADSEIVPDDGCVNPFAVPSSDSNTFTVYIVPANMSEDAIAKLQSKNICKISNNVKRATVILRQYLGTDEYGGVELPAIEAVDITTMKEVAAPLRMNSNVVNYNVNYEHLWSDDNDDVPFFLAAKGAYYPNNSTDYLYARTILSDDQVLAFSFIPASYPKQVTDYHDAPCRYWSVMLGSARDTHTYYSVYDEQVNAPDGDTCTFVVCMKQNPRVDEIRRKVDAENANGQHWRLFVWDRERQSVEGKEIGDCIVIIYRNILPNENWEHSIARMIPTPYGDPVNTARQDPDHMLAHKALGAYGPYGTKYSTSDFLNQNN